MKKNILKDIGELALQALLVIVGIIVVSVLSYAMANSDSSDFILMLMLLQQSF